MKMIISTKDDDCKLVVKRFDDAIRSLVDAIAGQNVPGGPYSDRFDIWAVGSAFPLRGWCKSEDGRRLPAKRSR